MGYTATQQKAIDHSLKIAKIRATLKVSKKPGWRKGEALPGLAWTLYSLGRGKGAIYVPASLIEGLGLKPEQGYDLMAVSSVDDLEASLVGDVSDPELSAALEVVFKHLGELGRFPLIVSVFGK